MIAVRLWLLISRNTRALYVAYYRIWPCVWRWCSYSIGEYTNIISCNMKINRHKLNHGDSYQKISRKFLASKFTCQGA